MFKLLIDGTTALGSNRYPTLEYDITVVAGQDNSIGMPIYLPALNAGNQLCVDEESGGTLKLSEYPGFAMTVGRGSATFPGGGRRGCLSVTPVNIDKIPMSPGFGQQPRFVVTIQPVGTVFNPPAHLSIPNLDALQPGTITETYSFDHDLGAFVATGSAVVSNDGTTIRSLPGAGVLKAGWHCGGDPVESGNIGECKPCEVCKDGRCVPLAPPSTSGRSSSKGYSATAISDDRARADENNPVPTNIRRQLNPHPLLCPMFKSGVCSSARRVGDMVDIHTWESPTGNKNDLIAERVIENLESEDLKGNRIKVMPKPWCQRPGTQLPFGDKPFSVTGVSGMLIDHHPRPETFPDYPRCPGPDGNEPGGYRTVQNVFFQNECTVSGRRTKIEGPSIITREVSRTTDPECPLKYEVCKDGECNSLCWQLQ